MAMPGFDGLILAHGSLEGVNQLWNGVLHPLRSPAHWLVLLGLGLFAGQRQRFRRYVWAFAGGMGAGLFGGIWGDGWVFPTGVPCGLAVLLGGVVVVRRALPEWLGWGIYGMAGAVMGWNSGPEDATGWEALLPMGLGAWVGGMAVLLNLANYAAMCPKRPWVKIAFRVLGSWIAAISVLYLALALRS
jgi:hydrogenase/urease accessory protein HupE